MKRPLDLFLAGLAVVVAVATVLRRSKGAEAQGGAGQAPGGTGVGVVGPGAPVGDGLVTKARSRLRVLADRLKTHNVSLMAAGLAYYAFFAVFPSAIAALSIYGLVSDPAELEARLVELTAALPEATADFIQNELLAIPTQTGLGVATVVAIVIAVWSASAGTKALISGINVAYGERETRSILTLRGMALLFTVAIIIAVVTTVFLSTLLPVFVDDIGLGDEMLRLIEIGRWPFIFVAVVIGLGLLYKWAPDRPPSHTTFLNWGATIAAAAWVAVTFGLSTYSTVAESARSSVYDALAGLAFLLLWFYLSGFVVLLGAEIDDEIRRNRRPR